MNSGRFGFVTLGFTVLTIFGGTGTFGCGCRRKGINYRRGEGKPG